MVLPQPHDQGFEDIDGNAHTDPINQLAQLGIVQGRTATSYAPARAVRRDQMATFLVRAYEFAHGQQLDAPPSGFNDTGGNTHETNIDKANTAGFTQGATATSYRPADPVRRDQMASFLARSLQRAAADGLLTPHQPLQPTLTNDSRLHSRGVGPAEAGMTLAEVEQQTGTRIDVYEFETFRGYCYYAQPEGVTAYTFLVLAPDDQPPADPHDGVIALAVTGFDGQSTATLAGVSPRDRSDAVEVTYGSSGLERHPHQYQPGGAYLDLYAADGEHGMRFSVNGQGAIEYIQSGDANAITFVEGCA